MRTLIRLSGLGDLGVVVPHPANVSITPGGGGIHPAGGGSTGGVPAGVPTGFTTQPLARLGPGGTTTDIFRSGSRITTYKPSAISIRTTAGRGGFALTGRPEGIRKEMTPGGLYGLDNLASMGGRSMDPATRITYSGDYPMESLYGLSGLGDIFSTFTGFFTRTIPKAFKYGAAYGIIPGTQFTWLLPASTRAKMFGLSAKESGQAETAAKVGRAATAAVVTAGAAYYLAPAAPVAAAPGAGSTGAGATIGAKAAVLSEAGRAGLFATTPTVFAPASTTSGLIASGFGPGTFASTAAVPLTTSIITPAPIVAAGPLVSSSPLAASAFTPLAPGVLQTSTLIAADAAALPATGFLAKLGSAAAGVGKTVGSAALGAATQILIARATQPGGGIMPEPQGSPIPITMPTSDAAPTAPQYGPGGGGGSSEEGTPMLAGMSPVMTITLASAGAFALLSLISRKRRP